MNNIYVIDGSLTDIQAIVQQLPTGSEYLVVDIQQDGILQLRDYLQGFQAGSVAALHIVSHGSDGQFALGSAIINNDTLDDYHSDLAAIGKYLSDSADVLLYGCNIAHTEAGKGFVQRFAAAISADVAASDDITTAPAPTAPEIHAQPPVPALPPLPPAPQPEPQEAEESGDSELEYEVGEVETTIHAPVVAATAPLQMEPSEPDTTPSHAFGVSGDRNNGITVLGGVYSGRYENYSEAHNYIITENFRGFAHIVNNYYDPNGDGGGRIYFDKGVEIVGIAAGAVRLATGGIVRLSFPDELHIYAGGAGAVSYNEFYTAVTAEIAADGTYTIGSHIDIDDIEYGNSGTRADNFTGGDEQNLFTFGFSRPVEANGGGGADTYRLSRFQTENARISDRSGSDSVILEYGVQMIEFAGGAFEFEFIYIGGDKATPTAKTLTVEGIREKTYQIGDNTDLRFTSIDFGQAFANTGTPIDLALAPEIRRQWLDSNDLATIPAGTGVIANLSGVGYFEEGVEIAPAGKAVFYNADGVIKDDNGIAYGLDIGENAFRNSTNDNNIYGSAGDDVIITNGNDNYLNGGGGKDTFLFSGFIADNTIRDFESGTDTILINSDMNFSIDRNRYVTITDDQNKVFGYISFFGGQPMASDIVKSLQPDNTAETTYNVYSYDGEGDYTIRGTTITQQGNSDRSFDETTTLNFTNRTGNDRIILEDIDAKITRITTGGDSDTLDMSAIFANMRFDTRFASVTVGDDYSFTAANFQGYVGGGKDDVFVVTFGDYLFDGKGADTEYGDEVIYPTRLFTGTLSITADNQWQVASENRDPQTLIDIENISFGAAADATFAANDDGYSGTVTLNLSTNNDSVTLQSPYGGLSIKGGSGDDRLSLDFTDTITISTDTITSDGRVLRYENLETIVVNNNSMVIFDDLNLPVLSGMANVGIGDNLESATITVSADGTSDSITDESYTITIGKIDKAIGGVNDDVFNLSRQLTVSAGDGADTIIADNVYGSNHRGGGGLQDSITYTDLGATVTVSLSNGIEAGSQSDTLTGIETLNINGHDGGSTMVLSAVISDVPPEILHIAMIGGAGHVADFSRVSVDLTIDVGGQEFSYGDNTIGLVGFTDFIGGTGETRFIDGTTTGDNVYTGNSNTDTLEYKGSDNINGTIGIVDGDIVLSDSNYGSDILSDIETVTVASDSINDDTLLITSDIGGMTVDSGGGKDDLTIGIGADNFVVRGGGDDDEFSIANTALGGELYGDGGNDTFSVNNKSGQITAYGGGDDDQFIIGEKVTGGKFYGDGGADTFTINASATLQSLEIDGGEGADTIALQNNFLLQDGNSINGKIRFDNIETLTTSAELSTVTLQGVATAEDDFQAVILQGQAGQMVTASTGNVDFTISANASVSVNGYDYILNGFDTFKGGDDNTNFHLNQRQGSTIIAGAGADNFIISAEDISHTIGNFDGQKDTIDFTKTDASIFDLQITKTNGMTKISADHLGVEINVTGNFNADNNLLVARTKAMNTWTVTEFYRNYLGRENAIDTLDFDTNFGDYGSNLADYVYANLGNSSMTVDHLGGSLEIRGLTAAIKGSTNILPFSVIRMDNVIGSGGSDVLIGNDGANRLDGGQGGDDIFYGGKGDDIFAVLPMDGAGDFIGDFGIGGIAGTLGRDRIDLSGLALSTSVNFIIREADAMNAAHVGADIVIESSDSSFGVELALDSVSKAAAQNSGLDIDIYIENYFKNNNDIFIGYDPYGTPKTERSTHTVGSEFQWKNSDTDLVFATDKYDILNYANGKYDNKETAIAVNLSSTDVRPQTFIDSINLGRLQQMNLQLSGNTRYESFADNGDDSLYSGKVYSVDGVYGSAGDDIFYGSAAGEILDGKDGDNRIFGGGGNDVISVTGGGANLLHGGDGDDTISGGTGNDIIVAGAGSNTLSGGGGNDNFIIFADKFAIGTNTVSDFDVSDKVFVILDKIFEIAPVSMTAVAGAVEFSIEGTNVGKIEFTNQQDVTNFLPHISIVHVDDAILPNQIREPVRFSIDFDSSGTGAWQLDNEPADRQLTITQGQRFYLVWNDANTNDGVNNLAELSQAYSDGDFSVALNSGNLELTFANDNIITIDGADNYADTADDNFDAFIDAVGGEEWILF